MSSNFRFSPTGAERLSILVLLLAVALVTTSCGTSAQAAAPQNSLSLHGSFPAGTVGLPYNSVMVVTGGTAPYTFALRSGTIPPGVHLSSHTGSLSGSPTSAGAFSFEVSVTDSASLHQGSQVFQISVRAASQGGGGSVKVSVSPTSATLSSGQTQQFTATVGGTSKTGVTWSATSGSVDANGLYTAPTVATQSSAVITATSTADTTKSASATITVNPPNGQALAITTSGLPQGQVGSSYSQTFAASGGTTPYSWSISGGTPPGITMSSSGDFAGLPTSAGTFGFTVTVKDAASKTASGNFSATFVGGGNYDGPAELPRVTVPSAMSDTPAPGATISVNAGGDLQTALNNAHCGDVIQLQAGATFSGKFTVPAKNCDSGHWVIIRTSAADSALPAEGQRATPCFAGVASLPGRPAYPCNNPTNVMAKVEVTTQGDGPFRLDSGANFYRFIGLEVTRSAAVTGSARLIAVHGSGSIADHIVVDRSWLHGTLQDETSAGVALGGVTYAAVVDSYFSDFHCIAISGTCIDSHAIAGGVSNTQDGPFKIQNNFLEAAGEAIMFGGGAATYSPADIQILGNHFWKPWQWMKGNPNFVGGPTGNPFIVKNHLELKNAVRVQIEANLMENNWGGFSQNGHAILLTPKNQHTLSGTDICPLCQVTDVTIRYTRVSHAGGGMVLATVLSGDGTNGAAALAGKRWSIHDVVLDDLSKQYLGGGSGFEIMNSWPSNPLNNLTINHVTVIPGPDSHIMTLGNTSTAPMYGLVFTNNLVVTPLYPVWTTGGDPDGCAYYNVPIISIPACFTTYTFSTNGFVAPPTGFPPSKWPANNVFPQTIPIVQFTDYNKGNGGNYELLTTSPYKNKGSDGKDLGADVAGLNAALANVE